MLYFQLKNAFEKQRPPQYHLIFVNVNYLLGGPVVRAWDQKVCFLVISGLSHVVANIMITRGLYGC
jgi:hypothetical protein